MRAYQRDEEYRQWLRFYVLESSELFLSYRNRYNWTSEVTLVADLTYFACTTARRKQTLGEEYCSIEPCVSDKTNVAFPSIKRRWVQFLV